MVYKLYDLTAEEIRNCRRFVKMSIDLKKEFSEILTAEMSCFLKKLSISDYKELGRRIKAHLLGETESNLNPLGPSETKYWKLIKKIFYSNSEIQNSLNCMKIIPAFISHFPVTKKYIALRITKINYTRYHVENYLNEIYIYEIRLLDLISFLKNECNNNGLVEERTQLESLKKTVIVSLKGIILTRGSHVHETRFTDSDFGQLQSIELLSDNFEFLKKFKSIKESELKKKWIIQIERNNKKIEEMTKQVFEKIKIIVFNKLIPFYIN